MSLLSITFDLYSLCPALELDTIACFFSLLYSNACLLIQHFLSAFKHAYLFYFLRATTITKSSLPFRYCIFFSSPLQPNFFQLLLCSPQFGLWSPDSKIALIYIISNVHFTKSNGHYWWTLLLLSSSGLILFLKTLFLWILWHCFLGTSTYLVILFLFPF